ncbi:AEC family transporter [Schleiferilactobacillus harbinensis]|jgi:predicted permease|uniref:AEC family transporter n=3 Tax=Schleiferilactobacillus harbinensis TaxID=304207 RepID=A0A5P8Q134_9LACO|nr:AEC family permease [Schleiferilactobacillus harbinensis DSM 16991]MBO3092642.1 AEC family transporter [Schleiferilactobacillus harbinensis]HAY53369.1 malate permease [Lactobacillus sp.]MCT2908218.1 AEC family transporter [Schleiferilactobacillus harbinensis]QEU47743.1 AEC family transporter [Schleiferilactobacillus harbinensis]
MEDTTMLKALTDTLTNMNVVSAVTSTIFIILLGFFLRRRGIFSDSLGKTLSKVVLTVALPALAFNSFMQPIDPDTLRQGINVLIWGIIIYVILILVTPFMYFKSDKDKKSVLAVLTTFGSTTFFGIPIVGAVWGAKGVMYSSIFNIGYRIFLYSYAYIKLSGLKLEAKNIKTMLLNPIVIATFLGLFLWLFQTAAPQVTVPAADATGKMVTVAFYRIDQTAVWLFKPLSYLAALASPLAWLAIGVTLGSVSFKEAATDKTSWYYSWNKVVIVPLINLVLLFLLTATHILPVDNVALATIIVMMATPTAAVAAAYAIGFDHGALMTSNASFISTFSAVIAIPLWIVVLQLIKAAGMFGG